MTDWEFLEDEKDRLELFVALGEQLPYIWINGRGQPVDLRKVRLEYAVNIRDWMLKNSYRDTPFDDLDQYRVVCRTIARHEGRLGTARRALRRRV